MSLSLEANNSNKVYSYYVIYYCKTNGAFVFKNGYVNLNTSINSIQDIKHINEIITKQYGVEDVVLISAAAITMKDEGYEKYADEFCPTQGDSLWQEIAKLVKQQLNIVIICKHNYDNIVKYTNRLTEIFDDAEYKTVEAKSSILGLEKALTALQYYKNIMLITKDSNIKNFTNIVNAYSFVSEDAPASTSMYVYSKLPVCLEFDSDCVRLYEFIPASDKDMTTFTHVPKLIKTFSYDM